MVFKIPFDNLQFFSDDRCYFGWIMNRISRSDHRQLTAHHFSFVPQPSIVDLICRIHLHHNLKTGRLFFSKRLGFAIVLFWKWRTTMWSTVLPASLNPSAALAVALARLAAALKPSFDEGTLSPLLVVRLAPDGITWPAAPVVRSPSFGGLLQGHFIVCPSSWSSAESSMF